MNRKTSLLMLTLTLVAILGAANLAPDRFLLPRITPAQAALQCPGTVGNPCITVSLDALSTVTLVGSATCQVPTSGQRGVCDTTITPTNSVVQTFRVGAIINASTAATVTGLYGWQYSISYDSSLVTPAGDPSPVCTAYPDCGEKAVWFGSQANTVAGNVNWASALNIGAGNPGGATAVVTVAEDPVTHVGKITIAWAFVAPSVAVSLSARSVLASVAFELVGKGTPTFTVGDVIFSNISSVPFAYVIAAPPPNPSAIPPQTCITPSFAFCGQVTDTITNDPPHARFTVAHAGTSYTFTSTSTDDLPIPSTGYTWDFGDKTPLGTGASVTHDYGTTGARTAPGKFTVTLRVTDSQGATGAARDSGGLPITNVQPSHTANDLGLVEIGPVASFTFNPPTPNSGTSVNFDASGSTYPDEPLLHGTSPLGGTPLSNADPNLGFVDANSNGVWDQGETIVEDVTPDGTYDTGDIVVSGPTPAVGAAINCNNGLCLLPGDLKITFVDVGGLPGVWDASKAVIYDTNGDSIYDGITNYAWDFGDGTTGTGVTASHTYTSASSGTGYPAKLTVTDNLGGTSSITHDIIVAGGVTPLVAPLITVSPSTIDSGQSSTLSTTTSFSGGTAPYTCQWLQKAPGATSFSNLGGSFACTAGNLPTNPTTTLSTVGAWSFQLQVTDSSATPQVATSTAVTVTVNPALNAPVISANSTTVDSGQSSMLSTTTVFSGGSSPFGCQWLQKSPGATSFTNLGSSFSCTSASPPSASTGTLSTVGIWSFELQVRDSAGTPITVTSNTVTVTVNAALVAPVISASPSTINTGMSATLSTSTSFNGGTSPYTCRWLQKSPTATTFSNLGASFTCTAGSLSSVPTGTLSTLGSWSFELQVTDGAATPVTVTSNTVTVTVQAVSTLTAPVISVSPSTIDSGQSATLSTITSFTGGTSPYTCQWLQKAPGATVFSNLGASFICTAGSLPTTPTGTLTTTGTWSLELQVTDSSATAQVATSAAVSVTVNAALGVNTPTANPSTVTSGGSSQLSASFTGGTSPYTCQWLQEAPSTTSFTNLGTSSSCTSPTSISSGTLTTTGAWMFELKVTDSAGTPVTVTSGAVTVTATPVTLDATTTNVSCTPTTVVVNQGSSCTVTVTDTSTTSPTVPTGTVTFTPGGPCTLQPATGPSATCSVPVTPINLAVTPLPVNAVYGGDASHSGSRSNTVNLTVTARSTTTSMTCVPSAVNVGIATTCTVTVTDTDIGGSIPPHGQVTVSSSGTGTFIGSPCNLSGTSATTTCHVTYTPGGTAPRTDKLTADYAPATTHLISSGNFQLGITSQVPPVASFTESATTVPTLTAINFDASASTAPSGTITSYAWDFGDTMTATGVTVSHSYAKAGTYTVMLTVSDSLGHTASASATKTITDRPPTASFTFSPAAPSVGQSVSFDGSGSSDVDGTITSYAWNFGDSSTGSGVTVTHTYTATGTFIVTLTVTDNSGNTGSSSAPIIVSQVSATGGHVKLIGYRAAPGFSIQNLQLDATQTLFAMGKNDGNITVKVYVLFNIKTPSGTSLVLYTQVVQLSPNQVINGRNDTRFSAQFKPMPGSYTVIATIYYSPSSSTRGDPSFKPDNASTKTFTFTVLGARFNGDEALTFAHTFHATSTQTFNAQEVNRANIPLLTRIDITVTNPDGTISSFTSPSFLLNPSQNRKDISFNLPLSNQNGHYCFTATLKYGIDTNGNGVLDNNEILGRGKTVKGCFNVVPNDGLAQNSCDDEDDD